MAATGASFSDFSSQLRIEEDPASLSRLRSALPEGTPETECDLLATALVLRDGTVRELIVDPGNASAVLCHASALFTAFPTIDTVNVYQLCGFIDALAACLKNATRGLKIHHVSVNAYFPADRAVHCIFPAGQETASDAVQREADACANDMAALSSHAYFNALHSLTLDIASHHDVSTCVNEWRALFETGRLNSLQSLECYGDYALHALDALHAGDRLSQLRSVRIGDRRRKSLPLSDDEHHMALFQRICRASFFRRLTQFSGVEFSPASLEVICAHGDKLEQLELGLHAGSVYGPAMKTGLGAISKDSLPAIKRIVLQAPHVIYADHFRTHYAELLPWRKRLAELSILPEVPAHEAVA